MDYLNIRKELHSPANFNSPGLHSKSAGNIDKVGTGDVGTAGSTSASASPPKDGGFSGVHTFPSRKITPMKALAEYGDVTKTAAEDYPWGKPSASKLDDDDGCQALQMEREPRPDAAFSAIRDSINNDFKHLDNTRKSSSKPWSKPFRPTEQTNVSSSGKKESKHFQSLQIFTSHAEPCLDEFLSRREQIELENKHRDEEDKLYR